MPLDVIIVGGGIGGAVLANLLGRSRKSCIVLEREAHPLAIVRPEILWPATVATLSGLLPARELHGSALLPLHGLRFFLEGAPVLRVMPADLARARVQPYSTDPGRTRELLTEAGGFELRRGVEVTEVLRHGSRVVGVRARDTVTGVATELLADWTVGDDGAHSRVREACGIPIRLRTFPVDFLCFATDQPGASSHGLPTDVRLWLRREHGMLDMGMALFPLPRGRAVGLVPVRHDAFEDAPRLAARWRAFLESNAEAAEAAGGRRFPEDFVHIRRAWGHARRYGGAGAALLGDAAHPVSPAGGQGANMSVADAVELADALVRRPSNFLAEYEQRRRPANRRSMLFTRGAAAVLALPAALTGRLGPAVLQRLGRRTGGLRAILRQASTAFQG